MFSKPLFSITGKFKFLQKQATRYRVDSIVRQVLRLCRSHMQQRRHVRQKDGTDQIKACAKPHARQKHMESLPYSTAQCDSGKCLCSTSCNTDKSATSCINARTNTSAEIQGSISLPKRKVRTERVNCKWLYNQVQASTGIILVDTRPKPDFERDTISTAISIPPSENCISIDQIVAYIPLEYRACLTPKKRSLREVVLFGNALRISAMVSAFDLIYECNTEAEKPQDCWMLRLAKIFVEDGLVMSVKILSDGFATFKHRYHFCTTLAYSNERDKTLHRTLSGMHAINYPNEILEGFLFLGNMWHAQSKKVLRDLGITHIVNASLDVGNVFENIGVLYCIVTIKDRPEENISQFFEEVFAFIENAKRIQHARVLVHCTQGISRSGTLVIMYLMRARYWSLVTATNFVLANRGVVYPNAGFLHALMEEEMRLYNGNSITESELDSLLQDKIPDRPLPLEVKDSNASENCSLCCKVFKILDWKYRCSFCKKEFCSKCSSIRIANQINDNKITEADDSKRSKRICDVCVSRLWHIHLPRPRKGLHYRYARCKELKIHSLSSYGQPVGITYYEGSDGQQIMNVIKKRFLIKSNQIMDLSTTSGEPIRDLLALPHGTRVLLSVGKPGNFNGVLSLRNTSTDDIIPDQTAPRQSRTRTRLRSLDSLLDEGETSEQRVPASKEECISMIDSLANSSVACIHNSKFRHLWKLAFPSVGNITFEQLSDYSDPIIQLINLMLIVSVTSCGSMSIPQVKDKLSSLGYEETHQSRVLALLQDASCDSNYFH